MTHPIKCLFQIYWDEGRAGPVIVQQFKFVWYKLNKMFSACTFLPPKLASMKRDPRQSCSSRKDSHSLEKTEVQLMRRQSSKLDGLLPLGMIVPSSLFHVAGHCPQILTWLMIGVNASAKFWEFGVMKRFNGSLCLFFFVRGRRPAGRTS